MACDTLRSAHSSSSQRTGRNLSRPSLQAPSHPSSMITAASRRRATKSPTHVRERRTWPSASASSSKRSLPLATIRDFHRALVLTQSTTWRRAMLAGRNADARGGIARPRPRHLCAPKGVCARPRVCGSCAHPGTRALTPTRAARRGSSHSPRPTSPRFSCPW